MTNEELAHEMWAASQLTSGESITDGVVRILEILSQQAPSAGLQYAKELAQSLHGRFYKDEAPEFTVLDELMGVLSQIDNMVTGIKAPSAIPEGYVLVPIEIMDAFPEISPSNYDHDDVCKLNAWGVELVLAAAPKERK